FAARNLPRLLITREPERVEQIGHAMRIIAGTKARARIVAECLDAGEIGFLWQIADRDAGLYETLSGIGLDQAGGDPKKRRLPGAVAANQTKPRTFLDNEFGAVKQGRAAIGDVDIFQEQTRGHGEAIASRAGINTPVRVPSPGRCRAGKRWSQTC